jgi:hypothetical protein
MEKLKLDLDALEVESFAPAEVKGVVAYAESEGASNCASCDTCSDPNCRCGGVGAA